MQLDTVAEVMFVKMLLEFLAIPLKLPIIVYVDNLGAIYLSQSASTSNRTKHIDTHYHFIREYIKDGILQIKFVCSEENHAFTKNLPRESYMQNQNKIMGNG